MKSSAAFASAILATVLAGSPLLAAPQTEEKEKSADTCLLGPSASTPPGGHWYYRQDRANKRNCWYLGDAKGKAARKQVAEEDAAVPEKPVAPSPKKPAAQRQMTDARAEFPRPQASVEPNTKPTASPNTQWPAMAPVDAPRADETRADEPGKVVTTRWPEAGAASPPATAAPAPSAAVTPPQPQAQAQPQPQPQSQAQTQAAPVAAPRPAAPPAPVAAKTIADQPLSLPMLLTVLVAGLSVIGVLASAMFGRGKSRAKRLARSAPMPPAKEMASVKETPESPRPQPQPRPEQARTPDDPNKRLQEMLAEIQRRAAA